MSLIDTINPYAWIVKLIRYSSKPITPDIPSITVGNLRTGGTGKTPFVIELAKRLEDAAVITLGYGRKYKGVYSSDEYKDPYHLGDEGYMIFKKTGRIVIAAKNRIKAIEKSRELGAKYLIFDDAFQYFRLRAHVNVLLLRPSDINANVLPFGPLREPFDSYKNADILVFNLKVDEDLPNLPDLEKPTYFVHYKVIGIKYKGEMLSPKGLRVYAFCGIADPFSFIKSLKVSGCELAGYKIYPDHWWISERSLRRIKRKAEEIKAIPVCTEKDFYRLNLSDDDFGVLKVELIGEEDMWRFIMGRLEMI